MLATARTHPSVKDDPAALAGMVGVSGSTVRRWLQQPAEVACTGSQDAKIGQAVTSEGQNQKAKPCKGLRTLSAGCAAHLSPCQITRSGEDRIRTCGAVSHPPI
jgi:hypothetical protein